MIHDSEEPIPAMEPLPGIGSGSGSFVQKVIPIPESEISGIKTALAATIASQDNFRDHQMRPHVWKSYSARYVTSI